MIFEHVISTQSEHSHGVMLYNLKVITGEFMKNVWCIFLASLLFPLSFAGNSMSKNKKLQTLSSVLLSSKMSSLAKGGDRTGSGGQGIVCRDPVTKRFTKAYLRDYAEAKIKNKNLKIDLGGPSKSVKQKVILLMKRVKQFDVELYNTMAYLIFNMSTDEEFTLDEQSERSEFLESLERFDNTPADVVSFISDYNETINVELEPIDDATSVTNFSKSNCGYKQFASQSSTYLPGEPLIAMDKKVVSLFSRDDYAGAIFHELLIFAYNAISKTPLESTDSLRAFNAALASNRFNNESILKFNDTSSQEMFSDWLVKIGLAEAAELRLGDLSLEFWDVPVRMMTHSSTIDGVVSEIYDIFLVGNSVTVFGYIDNCSGVNCRDYQKFIKIEKRAEKTGNFGYLQYVSFSSDQKSKIEENYSNLTGRARYVNNNITSLYANKITISYRDENESVHVLDLHKGLIKEITKQENNNMNTSWRTYSAKPQDIVIGGVSLHLERDSLLELYSLTASEGPRFSSITVKRTYSDFEFEKLGVKAIYRYGDTEVQSCLTNSSRDFQYKIVTTFAIDHSNRIVNAKESCLGESPNAN
jgi:hypothetical protein